MPQSIEEKKRKKKEYDRERRSKPEYKESFNAYRRELRKNPDQKEKEAGYTRRANSKPQGKKRRQEFDRKYRKTERRKETERARKSSPEYKRKRGEARKKRGTGYRKLSIFEALIERDGTLCAICGKALPQDESGSYFHQDVHVDHIIPISKGGERKSLENLRLAHSLCNLKRGNRNH